MTTAYDLMAGVISRDGVSTHDWGDDTAWSAYPEGGWTGAKDSTFEIAPNSGEALVLLSARVRFSVNIDMHSPLYVKYCIDGIPVKTTVYSSKNDFLDRFGSLDVLPVQNAPGYTADVWSLEFKFPQPLVLWSSSGFDAGVPRVDGDGNVKLGSIKLSIGDHEPYQKTGGGAVDIARVRYPDALICADPDYVAP